MKGFLHNRSLPQLRMKAIYGRKVSLSWCSFKIQQSGPATVRSNEPAWTANGEKKPTRV